MLIRHLRSGWPSPRALMLLPLKDLLIAYVWLVGLMRRTIIWRGNVMRIEAGSVLRSVNRNPQLQSPRIRSTQLPISPPVFSIPSLSMKGAAKNILYLVPYLHSRRKIQFNLPSSAILKKTIRQRPTRQDVVY